MLKHLGRSRIRICRQLVEFVQFVLIQQIKITFFSLLNKKKSVC